MFISQVGDFLSIGGVVCVHYAWRCSHEEKLRVLEEKRVWNHWRILSNLEQPQFETHFSDIINVYLCRPVLVLLSVTWNQMHPNRHSTITERNRHGIIFFEPNILPACYCKKEVKRCCLSLFETFCLCLWRSYIASLRLNFLILQKVVIIPLLNSHPWRCEI